VNNKVKERGIKMGGEEVKFERGGETLRISVEKDPAASKPPPNVGLEQRVDDSK